MASRIKFEYKAGEPTQTEKISLGVGTWIWTGEIIAVEIKGEMVTLAKPIPYEAIQKNTSSLVSCNFRTGNSSHAINWDITVVHPGLKQLEEWRARLAKESAGGIPRCERTLYSPEVAGYYIGASTHHIDRDPGESTAVRRLVECLMRDYGNAARYNKPHYMRQFLAQREEVLV